jgi:hypothetical protein
MTTLYFTKRFTSGTLTGLTVHGSVTASAQTLKAYRLHATGRDYGTRAKWVIVDASCQNYQRG